jgi:hypothetical protein
MYVPKIDDPDGTPLVLVKPSHSFLPAETHDDGDMIEKFDPDAVLVKSTAVLAALLPLPVVTAPREGLNKSVPLC